MVPTGLHPALLCVYACVAAYVHSGSYDDMPHLIRLIFIHRNYYFRLALEAIDSYDGLFEVWTLHIESGLGVP
jgi:hypothetical protein